MITYIAVLSVLANIVQLAAFILAVRETEDLRGRLIDREHRILLLEANNRDLQLRLEMCQTEPCAVSSKLV